MATKEQVLGIVSPVPMGVWNESTTYKALNIVRRNGAAYIAKKANINVDPETDTKGECWMLLAKEAEAGAVVADGIYPQMTVGKATNAEQAESATNAEQAENATNADTADVAIKAKNGQVNGEITIASDKWQKISDSEYTATITSSDYAFLSSVDENTCVSSVPSDSFSVGFWSNFNTYLSSIETGSLTFTSVSSPSLDFKVYVTILLSGE